MARQAIYRHSLSFLLVAAALSLAACAKKEDSPQVRTGGGTPNGSISQTCSNGASAVGRIYDSTYEFQQNVANFLSATLNTQDPQQLGTVYKVDMQGALKFDAQGNILANQAQLLITVYDSLVGTINPSTGQAIQPYTITFAQAAGGSLQAGKYVVTFRDEHGEVIVDGRIDNTEQTQGLVTFKNYKRYDGGPGLSGKLGYYQISKCGLLK